MSLFRRIFDTAYRKARRAEGRGNYREAAALYVEADMPDEAAHAFLVHATRAKDLDARVSAFQDALRWLAPDHPKREEIEAQIGLSILDEAQRKGAHTHDERSRLERAAAQLEAAQKDAEAATAYEILGRTDDVARCLEKAGEVDRLEALLDAGAESRNQANKMRRLVSDYEMALAVGARAEALDAIARAVELDPDDRSATALLRSLEERMLRGRRLRLRVDGREIALFGDAKVVLGRDADVSLRGASVSRRHAEVTIEDDALIIRDLGSRNGTLTHGVPIVGELRAEGSTEIGLGDDVHLSVSRDGATLKLEVIKGLDRDLVILAGSSPLVPAGLKANICFVSGHPTLTADSGIKAMLGRQPVAAPIALLSDDIVDVDGVRVEVV